MGRRRGQPYSQDLRDRVLAATGEPIRAVAARLAVSPSYVSKVQSKLRLTGVAAAGPQHNHTRPRLEPFYDVLRARVAEQADATIEPKLDARRELGGVDAPRRHQRARVAVSTGHLRRRPWIRLARSGWTSRSTSSKRMVPMR
jgi:hypothetical protein